MAPPSNAQVLACLKNDSLTDPGRKREVEKLINSVAPETFGRMVSTGKKITDYMVEDAGGNEKLDDELGVAVVFDEEDEVDEDGNAIRQDDDGNLVDEEVRELLESHEAPRRRSSVEPPRPTNFAGSCLQSASCLFESAPGCRRWTRTTMTTSAASTRGVSVSLSAVMRTATATRR